MSLEKAMTPEGLRVYVDTIPTAESAYISTFVAAGSVHEPKKLAGISHALEHCVTSSTEMFPNVKAFYDFCGANSIESNAYTTYAHTLYYGNGPLVSPIVQSMGDYLFRATYDPEQVAKEMLAINREAHMLLDESSVLHDTAADYGLFNKPYGRWVIGHTDKLDFTPDQLREYYRRHYTYANMAVIAVGNVRIEELMRDIGYHFGEASTHPTPTEPKQPRRLDVNTAGLMLAENDNALITVSTALDKPFIQKYLDRQTLYETAMRAIRTRCHERLRYDAGLSYDGEAAFVTENHPNAWSIQGTVTTSPQKIKLARKIFADVLEQSSASYSDSEIDSAIGHIRGDILRKMDAPDSRADMYIQALDWSTEPTDLSAVADSVRNLSHEEVRQATDEIVEYLAAHRNLTQITGPKKAIKHADIIIDQSEIA